MIKIYVSNVNVLIAKEVLHLLTVLVFQIVILMEKIMNMTEKPNHANVKKDIIIKCLIL